MNYQFMYKISVIILLLANIFFTIYLSDKSFFGDHKKIDATEEQLNTTTDNFPEGLGAPTITKIFLSISEAYSARDFEKLVALLDPEIVNRFGRENILKELNKLYGIFGPIREGFFSSIIPIGTTDNKLYKIAYDVGLSKASQVGQKAILLVTVEPDSNGYKIKGIFLNSPSDQQE